MSEEDYYTMLKAGKRALTILWDDMKRSKAALVIIVCYFAFMELVLHNGCPFVVVTGFPCPACGLTRAGIHLLRGEWGLAWERNLMIFPVAALIIAAAVRRYFLRKPLGVLVKYMAVLVAAMVVYYIYRMASCFPGEPPMSFYYDNLIHRIVQWTGM